MSDQRICPECGSDIYRASHYDELREARDRHWDKNISQAYSILRLELEVAELKEWRRTRNRKIEMQRRTIVRLEKKLREAGIWPHDNRGSEGDPTSISGAITSAPPSEAPDYPSPRGLRKMKKARERMDES